MLFIDGANWHYGLKSIGVDSGRLDYRRLARKLLTGAVPFRETVRGLD